MAVFPRCSLLTYQFRYARRSRLEKQPTDRRRKPRYLWDRTLDSVQDYTSPDGKYVATLRTESGAALVPWYHSYVLVHPASVSTQEAIDWGKPYLVLRGDGDASVKWESSKVLNLEVLRDSGDCGTYEIAPMDQSQQILIHFKM